jgi:hypothetical protein
MYLTRFLPLLMLPMLLLMTGVAAAQALVPLATNCDNSVLAPHTGFQIAPACVETSMGELNEAAKNPSLLIVEAPDKVQRGRDFQLAISTRNLKRDRFLAAGQGGYYLESSLLDAAGLQRGHFHVACRVLVDGGNAAPSNPQDVPGFFRAVEDGGGSGVADTVTVVVTNNFKKGDLVQCAAWAGDGSHRTPMMQRANQTPAFDAVRIKVQ